MFLFKQQSQAVLGLEFQTEGVAVALNRHQNTGAPPEILFLEGEGKAQLPLLKNWTSQNKLGRAKVNVVLNPSCYQILLVESPDVPEEEVRAAIRWRLQDLLNIPVEDAVLDVFWLPDDGTRSHKKMVYVVAVARSLLEQTIDNCKSLGLRLNAIDIIEMSMRNIAYSLIADDQRERGIAITRLARGTGSVFLYKQGNMYLARNFKLDYNAGLMDDIPQESLALELQRSVDYYERQMGQAPPSSIFVCGENVHEDKIGATLKSSFSAPVHYLNPPVETGNPDAFDQSLLQRCVGALGASLRGQVAIDAAS